METQREKAVEKFQAEYELLLDSNSPQFDKNKIREFEEKLRKQYLGQIEHIEQKFENVVLSSSQNDVCAFLFEHNFIFRALSANPVIYVDCNLASGLNVDCILVGFKAFDPSNLWVTLIKLERANFNFCDTKETADNYLSSSIIQINQWASWVTTNAEAFERHLKWQIRKDLVSIGYSKKIDRLEFRTSFFVITGYKSIFYTPENYPPLTPDEHSNSIKIITYDSLFKIIFEENNRPTTYFSTAWETENICASENGLVIKNIYLTASKKPYPLQENIYNLFQELLVPISVMVSSHSFLHGKVPKTIEESLIHIGEVSNKLYAEIKTLSHEPEAKINLQSEDIAATQIRLLSIDLEEGVNELSQHISQISVANIELADKWINDSLNKGLPHLLEEFHKMVIYLKNIKPNYLMLDNDNGFFYTLLHKEKNS